MDSTDEPRHVTFEGEGSSQGTQPLRTRTGTITQLAIKYSGGLVKNESQANVFLLGLVVVSVICISALLLGNSGSKAQFKAPPGQEVIYPENEPPRLQPKS